MYVESRPICCVGSTRARRRTAPGQKRSFDQGPMHMLELRLRPALQTCVHRRAASVFSNPERSLNLPAV